MLKIGWMVVGLRPVVVLWDMAYRESALLGGLSKKSLSIFRQISEKITENFKRLGRQAYSGIEPITSDLRALSGEPLRHWWC